MKLITKEIERLAPKLYSSEKIALKPIIAKFFCPWNNWTWFMTEYDPSEKLAFGYVKGDFPEWGYFSITELESVSGPGGLKIERDLHYGEHTIDHFGVIQ